MSANSFVEKFKLILEHELPGEEAHTELMPVNRPYSSDALRLATDYRQSAVGVVLYATPESVNCILTQRPDYNGVHSKQISFPGGKMDFGDPDLEYTARRECMEEIALESHHIETLGELSQVYIPVSKFLVQPYIFYAENLPELKPDPREVEEIFSFDIEQLLNDQVIKRTDMRFSNGFKQKDVPYFDINGRVVWGATAMILSEFRAVLKKL